VAAGFGIIAAALVFTFVWPRSAREAARTSAEEYSMERVSRPGGRAGLRAQ
jgi:hypothetical protein